MGNDKHVYLLHDVERRDDSRHHSKKHAETWFVGCGMFTVRATSLGHDAAYLFVPKTPVTSTKCEIEFSMVFAATLNDVVFLMGTLPEGYVDRTVWTK